MNKRKNKKQYNNYLSLDILALGGELGDDKSTEKTPAQKEYEEKLKLWEDSQKQFNDLNKTQTTLVDKATNPEAYQPIMGLVPKRVYRSRSSDNAFFYDYEKPTMPKPASTTPTPPKVGVYRDPYTNQPLPVDIYGSPGSEDQQLAQGVDLSTMTLEYKKQQEEMANKIQHHKELLSTMTPEQREAFKEARKGNPSLTLDEFLEGSSTASTFAYGGSLENSDEENLDGTLPHQEYNFVNTKKETAKGATSGVLKGAATGASVGSIIPGWGTAVGAIVGGIAGGITGGIKSKKEAKSIQEANQKAFEHNSQQSYDYLKQDDLMFALGGELNVDNIEGPTHDDGGIPMGQGNEVEGGEAKVGKYIFSDRLTSPGSKRTFAQKAKAIELKYAERDNDAPAMRSKEKELASLIAENEIAKKKKQFQDAMLNEQLKADHYAYGGRIKCDTGGKLYVDNHDKELFKKLSKNRNLTTDDYLTKMYALGGKIDGNPPFNEDGPLSDMSLYDSDINPMGTKSADSWHTTTQDSEISNNDFVIRPKSADNWYQENTNSNLDYDMDGDVLSGIEDYDIDDSYLNNTDNSDNSKFGNEEMGLIASSLPIVDNMINSFDNTTTKFQKVNPSLVDNSNERKMISNKITQARNTGRNNIRNQANSSGEYLSNMAAINSTLTDSEMGALSQSIQNENNTNAQILNANRAANAQISNEEIIANEQNKDIRRATRNAALANTGDNIQGYLRDKKLTSENKRQNDRVVNMINSMGYNYKWEDDNGEFALKIIDLLNNKKQNG